jgi:hypothetical protein
MPDAREAHLRAFAAGPGVALPTLAPGSGASSVGDVTASSGGGGGGALRVLVCTDLASRGLDLGVVDYIVQFDFALNVVRASKGGCLGWVTVEAAVPAVCCCCGGGYCCFSYDAVAASYFPVRLSRARAFVGSRSSSMRRISVLCVCVYVSSFECVSDLIRCSTCTAWAAPAAAAAPARPRTW